MSTADPSSDQTAQGAKLSITTSAPTPCRWLFCLSEHPAAVRMRVKDCHLATAPQCRFATHLWGRMVCCNTLVGAHCVEHRLKLNAHWQGGDGEDAQAGGQTGVCPFFPSYCNTTIQKTLQHHDTKRSSRFQFLPPYANDLPFRRKDWTRNCSA